MSALEKLNIFKRDKNCSESKQARDVAETIYEDQLNLLVNLEIQRQEVEDALADQPNQTVADKMTFENAGVNTPKCVECPEYEEQKEGGCPFLWRVLWPTRFPNLFWSIMHLRSTR